MWETVVQNGLAHKAPPPHIPRWRKNLSDSFYAALVSVWNNNFQGGLAGEAGSGKEEVKGAKERRDF